MATAAEVATPPTKRIAVVTGANKGIGLEICRQLASKEVMVILTARDEKRGLEAVNSLKNSGLSDIIFHQLDVMDPLSIASLADFVKTQFGRLDILVNNAAITGSITDYEAFNKLDLKSGEVLGEKAHLVKEITKQTYETAEACLKTNYFGAKQAIEAFLPLMNLSGSARIVNVSSLLGQLKFLSNERAKEVFNEVDSLTEEKINEVVKGFLEDAKKDLIEIKGWPMNFSAYALSKAAVNAYTRILAKTLPANICINAVSPGFVKTDMTGGAGAFTVEEGARGPVMLALMPDGGPSGALFSQTKPTTF